MLDKGRLATLVPVKKMDRAIRFYTKTLGGKVSYRPRGEMRKYWSSLELAGAPIWLVAVEKPEKRKLAYSTFLVKDIRAEVALLRKKRVAFDRAQRSSRGTKVEGPIAFEPFGASAFFKDSEGNLLMLYQQAG